MLAVPTLRCGSAFCILMPHISFTLYTFSTPLVLEEDGIVWCIAAFSHEHLHVCFNSPSYGHQINGVILVIPHITCLRHVK